MTQDFLTKLEDLFNYHPPKTDEEKELHNIVNQASISYVKSLAQVVKNPAELTTLIRKVQEVKMLANQALTYQREGISIRDLFSE